MGRKSTKKFTDKKKSATLRSIPRDSSADGGGAHGGDRVFVRVDKNPYSVVGTLEDGDGGGGGGGSDDGGAMGSVVGTRGVGGGGDVASSTTSRLPERIRREILELGFPDDGYNYLWHLREVRKAGGGSAFYENPKARLHLVPKDVKACDASRVQVPKAEGDHCDKSIYSVAANSINVRVQKAIDPEVAALLDDSDLLRFGSEVEDLEEDFVVQANHLEGKVGIVEENLQYSRMPEVMGRVINGSYTPVGPERQIDNGYPHEMRSWFVEENDDFDDEKSRERHLLDEQFDLEYGSEDIEDDSYGDYMAEEDESLALKLKQAFDDKVVDDLEIDDNYRVQADLLKENEVKSKQLQDFAADLIRCCVEYADKYENENDDKEVVIVEESSGDYMAEEDESLALKLKQAFDDKVVDDLEIDDNYRVPADLLKENEVKSKQLQDFAADFIHCCVEYADEYENENDDKEVVIVEESSDESEVRDCETIVSTYSNFDNHPGKIEPPEVARKKELAAEKIQGGSVSRNEQPRRKQHGQESEEEKKECKAAAKEERREACRMKKEMKGLYRCEVQRAQKVAAITGPSSIPLM